jgi:energy-coupling factor transporter ATP-binding protein EcfA2
MELIEFRVTNFRNIINSGPVQGGRIVALVGQNECGKSNLLQALAGLNPFDARQYVIARDWPIDRWPPEGDNQIVCRAVFRLEPEDLDDLWTNAQVAPSPPPEGEGANEATPPPPPARPETWDITASRDYNNQLEIDLGKVPIGIDAAKASQLVRDRLPKCVYMDQYSVFSGSHPNFPDLWNRKEQAGLTEAESTLLTAIRLAALDLGQLASTAPQERTFYTTAGSTKLSRSFVDKWRQKNVEFDIRVDGTALEVFAKDEGLGAPIPLGLRSAGFQWYVSFIWLLTSASQGLFKDCILLLDEPGVRLHHAGHADLLTFLAGLSDANTVIYTTHLATMVDQAFPERVRIMEVEDHHSRVLNALVSAQPQPMMVIESALGLSGGMSGLLGARQNLIVEGVDDYLILHKLSGVLATGKAKGLSERIFLIPTHGASKSPMMAAFLFGNGLDAGILVDSDDAGEAAINKIKAGRVTEAAEAAKTRFRYLKLGDIAGAKGREFAIEDLFPTDFYLEVVNEAYSANLAETELSDSDGQQVRKRVEAALQRKGRIKEELDRRAVMRVLLKRFEKMTKPADFPSGTADKARKVIDAINKAFELMIDDAWRWGVSETTT